MVRTANHRASRSLSRPPADSPYKEEPAKPARPASGGRGRGATGRHSPPRGVPAGARGKAAPHRESGRSKSARHVEPPTSPAKRGGTPRGEARGAPVGKGRTASGNSARRVSGSRSVSEPPLTPKTARQGRRGKRRSQRSSPDWTQAASARLTSHPTHRGAYAETRRWLLAEHGPVCAYCERKFTPSVMTLDHVAPRRGQSAYDRRDNLVLACPECNAAKRDMAPIAFLLARRSRAAALLRYGRHLSPMLIDLARSLVPPATLATLGPDLDREDDYDDEPSPYAD